jgi:hypothetical protein
MRTTDSVTAAGVASRAKVHALVVADDLRAAAAEARANPHPWYRCQSLAHVAWAAKDDEKAAKLLREAIDTAKKQEEPNRIVSVASYAVSVCIERALNDMSLVVPELLQIISVEPNPIRRADALLLLLEAVMRDRNLRLMVLDALFAACAQSRGWKGRRILQFAALALANHQQLAREVLSRIPESRELRRAKAMLARRQWVGPHAFVPYYQKL